MTTNTNTNAQVVENNLFKKTQLQTSFSGNMLALGSEGTKVGRGERQLHEYFTPVLVDS